MAELVVGVAGGSADADLHEAGRAGGVGGAGAGGAGLEGAGGVGESALVDSSVAMPARISQGRSYRAPTCS